MMQMLTSLWVTCFSSGPLRFCQQKHSSSLSSKQGCPILREISSLSASWPSKSFRVQTVEDLGINSRSISREIPKLPKFQCPRNMVRVKSGNLLPYKLQSPG